MCIGTCCPSLHKGRSLSRSMLTGGFSKVAINPSCSVLCTLAAFFLQVLLFQWFISNADNCEDATEHVIAAIFRTPNFLNLGSYHASRQTIFAIMDWNQHMPCLMQLNALTKFLS